MFSSTPRSRPSSSPTGGVHTTISAQPVPLVLGRISQKYRLIKVATLFSRDCSSSIASHMTDKGYI